ncbi:hypothetical protein, partial [Actinobacillus pleuropneumoniae]
SFLVGFSLERLSCLVFPFPFFLFPDVLPLPVDESTTLILEVIMAEGSSLGESDRAKTQTFLEFSFYS